MHVYGLWPLLRSFVLCVHIVPIRAYQYTECIQPIHIRAGVKIRVCDNFSSTKVVRFAVGS